MTEHITRQTGATKDGRRIIVMQPGPLHLFWTTGVFYLWELKQHFDFVLIVPEAYRDSAEFQKLAALGEIRHVEYMEPGASLRRYRRYRLQFQQVLCDFLPSYVLVHNTSYPENQYLLHLARKLCPKAPRCHYQNGRVALMWEQDFAIRRAMQMENVIRKVPIMSRWPSLTGLLVDLRSHYWFGLHFKLLPLMTIGRVFSPPVNVFNGNVNIEAAQHQYRDDSDLMFTYLNQEAQIYRQQGVQHVSIIQHPLSRCGDDVFRFLYGDFSVQNQILILPSWGFTATLKEKGWDDEAIINHVSEKWCGAIESLLKAYPGFKLNLKLHPASRTDPVWSGIVSRLASQFEALTITKQSVSAEWLVAQSKVIVGDVTTVLWWAALYGNRVVISLDIFGFPGGDEMRLYQPLIYYVDSLAERIPDVCSRRVTESKELAEYMH